MFSRSMRMNTRLPTGSISTAELIPQLLNDNMLLKRLSTKIKLLSIL